MSAKQDHRSRVERTIRKLGPNAAGLFKLSEPTGEGIIQVAKPDLLTPAAIDTLKREKHYPELEVRDDKLVLSALTDQQLEMILLDLLFFALNPKLPLENLCSHVANYEPKNDSQRELLKYALALVEMFVKDQSKAMGLYMHGPAGVGKSHIAVALTKEFMRRGLDANFMAADSYHSPSQTPLAAGQVWIIDDMNMGYGLARYLFKDVVLNAHNRGGVVFITSNMDYPTLLGQLFSVSDAPDRIRYEDRTRSMIKILEVTGESNRHAEAWHAAVDNSGK